MNGKEGMIWLTVLVVAEVIKLLAGIKVLQWLSFLKGI